MVHIIRLAYDLHRVAEEIRKNSLGINSLILNVKKKVFFKAPYHINLFKNLTPGVSLPPEPIITRWGVWLNAVNYYCEYFFNILKVLYFN